MSPYEHLLSEPLCEGRTYKQYLYHIEPKKKINDGLTRQRRWQINKQKQGLCIICGEKAVNKTHCELHRQKYNILQSKT